MHVAASFKFWSCNSLLLPLFTNFIFIVSPQFNWPFLILYVPCIIVNCICNCRPLLLFKAREREKQEPQSIVYFLWVKAVLNPCGNGVSSSPVNTTLTGQAERGASLIILPVLLRPVNSSGWFLCLLRKSSYQKRRLYLVSREFLWGPWAVGTVAVHQLKPAALQLMSFWPNSANKVWEFTTESVASYIQQNK